MAPLKDTDTEKHESVQGRHHSIHSIASVAHEEIEIPEDFTEDAPWQYGFHQVDVAERPGLARAGTNVSTMSSKSTDPAFEVDWEEDDPENPRNRSIWVKSWAIFSCAFATTTM